MKQQYKDWIARNIKGDGYGMCREATEEMAAEFPELKRIRGHYYCPIWGERQHWWLLDGEEIVDPTVNQFPSKGIGEYVEFTGPEPTGMCPNCGGFCYDGKYCCSENCSIEYVAYCNHPW